MPPISQGFALSSSLVEANPDAVVRVGYGTIAVIVLFICLYVGLFLVKKGTKLSPDAAASHQGQTAGQILKNNWITLVPLMVLVVVIFFRTIGVPQIRDFVPDILGCIQSVRRLVHSGCPEKHHYFKRCDEWNCSFYFVCHNKLPFCFQRYAVTWKDTLSTGVKNVKVTVLIQLCAAFMLGSFYAGGPDRGSSGICPGAGFRPF